MIIIEIFLKIRKLKKNYANTKNNMPDEDQEKQYMKNYYYKRKSLLNHLTNYVEELKKCLS